jgi:hypothetical protein
VINDKELKQFHDWLEAKGEHPSVILALSGSPNSKPTFRKTRKSSGSSRPLRGVGHNMMTEPPQR